MADQLAERLGIASDAPERLRAALIHCLLEALTLKGLVFVERNFSSRYGEIDLIFKDFENGETLVFVEVKYRKNDFFGKAVEMVTQRKQKKILATSQVYILKNKWNSGVRYDIIGIDSFSNNIEWIKNAF